MKKQPTTVRTYLLRGAFLLSLLCVIVMPLALGQRHTPGAPAVCPNPWQEVARMPTDLYGPGCASDGTFVYCGGGYSFSSGNTLAVFNKYDPVADTWTPLPNMPRAAIMPTAVFFSNDTATSEIYTLSLHDALP